MKKYVPQAAKSSMRSADKGLQCWIKHCTAAKVRLAYEFNKVSIKAERAAKFNAVIKLIAIWSLLQCLASH